MLKEILVHVTREETQVGVLENHRLMEIYLERSFQARLAGNIYRGRIENVLPGMQAAFVNIGLERNAFLYVEDVRPQASERKNGRHLPIQNLLREGQEILVQVVKEPFGTKGARVTTQLTLPGRYVVFMPDFDNIGVSRRISSERERERLKAIAEEVRIPRRGLIIRTVAEGIAREDLERDVQSLYKLWQWIQEKNKRCSAPALVHQDLELVSWVLRDLFNDEVERLVFDESEAYEKVLELLKALGPQLRDRVQLTHRDLWQAYGLDQELERALRARVWLKSGGYLVIDEAEALTVIDVNTGKFVGGKSFSDTIFRTNLEAAEEIMRQIRLRNLGGIIVVDFIDMEIAEHRQEIIRKLEEELKRDKTRTYVLGLTQLGLVELTRKKVRPSISSLLERICPYCEGKGRILSEESVSLKACRELRELAATSRAPALLVEVHPSVAAFLIGGGGSHLRDLEKEIGKRIIIKGMDSSHLEAIRIRSLETQEEIDLQSAPVQPGEVIELRVEEPHATIAKDGIARLHGYVIDVENGKSLVGRTVKVEISRVFRTYAKGRVLEDAAGAGQGTNV